MQKLFFGISLLLMGSYLAHGQHNEWSGQLGSGLFSFLGDRVVRESVFILGNDQVSNNRPGTTSYTNDPFSSRSGISYGVTVQGQHVSKGNFLTGIQAGFESLATRTRITGAYDRFGQFIPFQQGSSTSRYQYVTLHPFIGKRIGVRRIRVDLTAGFDVAIGLYNWDTGNGTTPSNGYYFTDFKRPTPPLDLRPRLDLTAYYHAVGFTIGYAEGLADFNDGLVGGPSYRTNCQIWRAGLVYRSVH